MDIELIDEMSKNKENQILIFEAENNIIRKQEKIWISTNFCGTVVYCKRGADMARKENIIKKSDFAPIGVELLFSYGEVQK